MTRIIIEGEDDVLFTVQRGEYMRQIAGAIALDSFQICHADWIIGLLFEHEGYRQVVKWQPHSFIVDNGKLRDMTHEDYIVGLHHMHVHAANLIYLYQVPEDFDRWRNEGGK